MSERTERRITGRWMAYQGREGCESLLCRRMPRLAGAVGTSTVTAYLDGPCMGWHCAVCDEPSSQYGHSDCHEEDDDA